MVKERLQKVSKATYILPQEGAMRVPGKIFVSEKLLQNVEDIALQQVANAATLPGIRGYSLGMPDMHVGYGFTVGGVSGYDAHTGCISPGAIGFDINCLAGSSEILSRDGWTRRIDDLENSFDENAYLCYDDKQSREDAAQAAFFMKKPVDARVLRLTTESGREIVLTEDHPVFTKEGMVRAGELHNRLSHEELHVATQPFSGVPWEAPTLRTLVSWADICATDVTCNIQAKNFLSSRGLLPLTSQSKAIPALLRMMGFLFGDGTLIATKKSCYATFYGKPEDLQTIREDVFSLGVTASPIYSRDRDHRIHTRYGIVEFSRTEYSFSIRSKAFVGLLLALGVPCGDKVTQGYGIPDWILTGPMWHQRLFLGAYFGAELSTPSTMSHNHKTFVMPALSVNKELSFVAQGKLFLQQISSLLENFSVRCAPVHEEFSYEGVRGKKHRLRLCIYGDDWNLINLYQFVNFEYNKEKRFLANVAVQYLAVKSVVRTERFITRKTARVLYASGSSQQLVMRSLLSKNANARFLERSLYGATEEVRIPQHFPIFSDFVKEYTAGLGTSGFVWDEIVCMEETDFDGYVYDFTMAHSSHNFIANGLLVSNCGVRVLATDLDGEQVEELIEPLLELLFQKVPAGVGLKSTIHLSPLELDEVLREGSHWALKKGFATEEDIRRTEEDGKFLTADPSKVSDSAKKRGRSQLGTLGAGNHFLEVQLVDEIYDADIASRFGITHKGQVIVMIHCGSRGMGHQVCTDYLRRIEKEHPDIMASLPEKNLAYAPVDSVVAKDYWGAMCAAANFAFCNRQIIAHRVREAFTRLFPGCSVRQVYDIAHNIAKREQHIVDGEEVDVYVHRKGATRAFPPGREEICEEYRDVGQPVLIPGSMGTASYILVGTQKAMAETFGSSAHGAGRLMSRTQAKNDFDGNKVANDLRKRRIYVKAASMKGVAEEAPMVYKDIDEVIAVTQEAGIAKPVVRVVPLGVVKG